MLPVILRVILIPTILALLISCGSSAQERRESPEKILDNALGSSQVTPGKINTLPVADRSDLPYVPIVTPPEVMRVWIYDHVTPSNDLVIGHWVYVKITDQDWYIKNNFNHSKEAQQKLPSPPRSYEPQQQAQTPNVPAPQTTPPAPGSKESAQLESLINAARAK